MVLKPTGADDGEILVIEDDYVPDAIPDRNRTRITAVHPEVRIDDGQGLHLDDLDPRRARQIARDLARGVNPQERRAEGGNLFALARRNGILFYVFLAQCAVLFVVVLVVVNLVIGMPARAIPGTASVELYQRATADRALVQHFAEMLATRMETWNHWSAKSASARVTPFLDPSIRTVYESTFALHVRNADRFLERSIFEPVTTVYRGVQRETVHLVLVFYVAYNGRGKDEETFHLDRITRRVKILEIAEGAATDENPYGLYLVKHHDLVEEQWMRALKKNGVWENPWEKAMGIKQRKPKDWDGP